MPQPLVTDQLWARIEPLLKRSRTRRGSRAGRKPLGDREALTGILYILKTGAKWQELPAEFHCGAGMTCWRRLHEWRARGLWPEIENALRQYLKHPESFDWKRANAPYIQRTRASRKKEPGAAGEFSRENPAA